MNTDQVLVFTLSTLEQLLLLLRSHFKQQATSIVPFPKKRIGWARIHLKREILQLLQSQSRGFKPREVFLALQLKHFQERAISIISVRSTLRKLKEEQKVIRKGIFYYPNPEKLDTVSRD